MNCQFEIFHALYDFKNPYSLLAYRIIALHGLFLELCIFRSCIYYCIFDCNYSKQ